MCVVLAAVASPAGCGVATKGCALPRSVWRCSRQDGRSPWVRVARVGDRSRRVFFFAGCIVGIRMTRLPCIRRRSSIDLWRIRMMLTLARHMGCTR